MVNVYSGIPIQIIEDYLKSSNPEKILDEYRKERIRHYFVEENETREGGKRAEKMAEDDVKRFENIAENYLAELEEKERREEKDRSEKQIVVYKPPQDNKEYSESKYTSENHESFREEDSEESTKSDGIFGRIFGKKDKTINAEFEDITEGKKEKEPSKFEKLKTSMFGLPKTEKEKQREQEIREAEKEEQYKTKLYKIKESGKKSRKSKSSFQVGLPKKHDEDSEDDEDGYSYITKLGKGDMGSDKYDIKRPHVESREYKPDFFGKGSEFDFGTANPLGEPSRTKKTKGSELHQRPPSTTIPFGGSRPPSVSFPGGSGTPSVRIPSEKVKPPSTSFRGTDRISTKVPTIKSKPPSTKIGKTKVHTRIPNKKVRAPSTSTRPFRSLKPSEIKMKKPVPIKTKISIQKENPLDILGLRGYF